FLPDAIATISRAPPGIPHAYLPNRQSQKITPRFFPLAGYPGRASPQNVWLPFILSYSVPTSTLSVFHFGLFPENPCVNFYIKRYHKRSIWTFCCNISHKIRDQTASNGSIYVIYYIKPPPTPPFCTFLCEISQPSIF